ncbi:maleylpyruvate isomerase family mycothiol-dependent enzyme [Acidothermaceae bacterium B102]|nr:maleylpyruvate isomerase family mycothiol-dependent enzyme [Acidothermaceae bacterium B102]
MDRVRYLELLQLDGARLRAAATRGLDADVPACPGWTVADLVRHTAEVYEHKIACIQLGGSPPDPWPPSWPKAGEPLAWFDDAQHRLMDVLTSTDPAAPSWTWWPADQTAGFWTRRMAQETAVHRADAESASGDVSAIDTELAVDGIDEVLTLMLAGDWSEEPQPGPTTTVDVSVGGRSWQVTMAPAEVVVGQVVGQAAARVSGDPSTLLLWLWGRAADSAVQVSGDQAAARQLRERLALATG